MLRIVFLHHCYFALRSRSNVRVKVRGLALSSAAKSNNPHYKSKVFVCVSVISWRRRIIARKRSISF